MSGYLNSDYLERLGATLCSGTYGDVKVTRTSRGIPVLSKTAQENQSNGLYNELCLGKEALILGYLNKKQKTGHMFPRLFQTDHFNCKDFSITSHIHQEFVGPDLFTCKSLGFVVSPKVILRDLMEACLFLQKAGVLHLDIKSNNVTLDLDKGRVKLIDFGCSQMTSFVQIKGLTETRNREEVSPDDTIICFTNDGSFCPFNTDGPVPLACHSFPFVHESRMHVMNHIYNVAYRDPTLLCAEALGTMTGLVHDHKMDVFASAMVVLHSMNGQPEDGANGMLKFLSKVRGGMKAGEVEILYTTLLESVRKASKSMNSKRTAILYDILERSQTRSFGSQELLSLVYGDAFSQSICGACHPIQSSRYSAQMCLDKLEQEEREKVHPRKNKVPTWCVAERYCCNLKNSMKRCIWKMTMLNFEIASIVLDKEKNMLLWCFTLFRNNFKQKTLLSSAQAASRMLHAKCCSCNNENHAVQWYIDLKRDKRLDSVFNSDDPFKSILVKWLST